MKFSNMLGLVVLIFTVLPTPLNAQDTLLTYYNSDWDKVKPKKKSEADHYRLSFIDSDGKPTFKSYYMTGELKAEGFYKSKKYKLFDGEFTSYYTNGSKSSFGHFSEDKKIEKWLYWYEDGSQMNITHYNLEGEKHGLYKWWYEDSTIDCEGEFLNDKEVGEWKYYFENGQMASLEVYNKGELKGFKFWDEQGNSLNTTDRKVYERVNFGIGDKKLIDYISANFIYPPESRMVGIEGRVLCNFTIDKNGKLKDLKMTGTKNKLFKAEAKRLITGYNNWIPAKWHNRVIAAEYTLPIAFKMR